MSDNDSHAHLVVVIPGIGGSVLESPGGTVLWKASPPAVTRLLWQPDRFARDEIAHPVGLIKNWGILPGFAVMHGYHHLLKKIGKVVGSNAGIDMGDPRKENLDARVVAFPYDFRQSIVESAKKLHEQIERRLAHLGWTNQSNKVIIIAHSMGGLIARYWVAEDNWKVCRAVLTLGTPHRGAPKALEYLVNGPPWWIPGRRELLRELLMNWSSVYELVPRYRSVEDTRPQQHGSTDTVALYPKDLSLPGLQDKIARAFAVHRKIEDAWERNAAQTHCVAYAGRGHGTLLQASWDGTRLTSTKERPAWFQEEMGPEERGDGTVPEASAVPIEQRNHVTRKLISERHSRLVTAPECLDALTSLLAGMPAATPSMRDDSSLMIGLDLEDSYLRGYPVEVQARPTPRRLVDPKLSLTFELTGSGTVVRTGRLDRRAGGVWSTTFTDLPAGIYQLTVQAVPRDIFHLSSSECFFVLDERQQHGLPPSPGE